MEACGLNPPCLDVAPYFVVTQHRNTLARTREHQTQQRAAAQDEMGPQFPVRSPSIMSTVTMTASGLFHPPARSRPARTQRRALCAVLSCPFRVTFDPHKDSSLPHYGPLPSPLLPAGPSAFLLGHAWFRPVLCIPTHSLHQTMRQPSCNLDAASWRPRSDSIVMPRLLLLRTTAQVCAECGPVAR
jgi:hypothetical protein